MKKLTEILKEITTQLSNIKHNLALHDKHMGSRRTKEIDLTKLEELLRGLDDANLHI